MAAFGNIPTVDVLTIGTLDSIKRVVLQAIKDGFDSVVPASSLPLQAPIDNVRAISATVKEYNKKRGADTFDKYSN